MRNNSSRIILSIIFLSMLVTQGLAQSWKYLGEQWYVPMSSDLSVVSSGSNRVLYLAASNGSLLRASGNNLVWTSKPFTAPRLVAANPQDAKFVYAGVPQVGMKKSTNDGDTWTAINSGLTNLNLTRISVSPTNGNILLVGAAGPVTPDNDPLGPKILYRSSNGGNSWSPITNDLISDNTTTTGVVFSPSNSNIVYLSASGSHGGVWKSIDEGLHWTPKFNGIDNVNIGSLSISSVSTNIMFAATFIGIGKIYKTADGGESWTNVLSSTTLSIVDVESDKLNASTAYAATSTGILKTTDGGTTWVEMNSGLIDKDIRVLQIDVAGVLYAGAASQFYVSSDGGEKWVQQSNGAMIAPSTSVAIFDGTIYSVGAPEGGFITSSLRYGGSESWRTLSSKGPFSFSAKELAIDPTDANNLYVAGRSGDNATIFRSVNGGVDWTTSFEWQTDGTNDPGVKTIAIDPNSPGRLFAGTYIHPNSGRSLMISADHGATWGIPYYPCCQVQIQSIAIAKNTGSPGTPSATMYAVGARMVTRFLKSTNAGDYWDPPDPVYFDGTFSSAAVDLSDPNKVYNTHIDLAHSHFDIHVTTDGGLTHESLPSPWPANPNQVQYALQILQNPKMQDVLVVLWKNDADNTYHVSCSVNAGLTWTEKSMGLPAGTKINKLAFQTDPSTMQGTYLYAATDVGVYRIRLVGNPPQDLRASKYVAPDGGSHPRVYWKKSTDLIVNGYVLYRQWGTTDFVQLATFSTADTSYIDSEVYLVESGNQGVHALYYATSLFGSVESEPSDTADAGPGLGLEGPDKRGISRNDIPSEFSLSESFPNPFNPSTTIKYTVPEDIHVTLKVYDVLGREVTTLVDEFKRADWYEVQLNASSLSSGVYFYKLTAGKFTQAKKMLLAK